MKIFSQIIAILVMSFIVGLAFNTFSPHGIDIFDNSWSKHSSGTPALKVEHNGKIVQEESTIFVGFDRACQFVEDQEGPVLDARSPEAYVEGHIPGAHLLFFLQYE